MIVVGVIISLLIDTVIPFDSPHHNRIHDYILSILLTFLIWEGNLVIDKQIEKRISWLLHPIKRLFIQLPIGTIFSALTIYLVMLLYKSYICDIPESFKDMLFITAVVIGTLSSVLLIIVEISVQFFINWKKSLVEVEKYKTESIQAQLQNLKTQVNPHFLFNNLSVLSSLVYIDQDKAVDFINQLSKVYRYLLDNKDVELSRVEDELKFLESYNYLLQIRFDSNLKFEIHINQNALNKLIPPMSLQMLVENAIKHNEISSEQPLRIELKIEEDFITVSNNLQLRDQPEPSSKTGLKNIRDRYKHFTSKEVEVFENEKVYVVKLPLIKAS